MSRETSDEALRRSKREPQAFAVFYEQHAEGVLRYTARRVYDPEVAFDLAAETFAQAYLARKEFRGGTEDEAAAWLYTIAKRQLARYFRRGDAERRALRRLAIQLPTLDASQQQRIKELAGLSDLRRTLREELEQLSAAQRRALHLRVVEELPYSEVASRMGISEQAARARVSRGLKALAAALDGNPITKEALI